LARDNLELKIVEAHGPVREALRAQRLDELVGAITHHSSLEDAVAEHEASLDTRA
jgi:hypothetical protein